MGDNKDPAKLTIRIDSALKKDLDAIARMKNTSTNRIVREALKLYVQEEYYKRAEYILNIEDRVGMAVVTELYPQLEEIKNRLDMIADAVQTQSSQSEKTPAKEEDEEKIYFPKVPGLHYKVDGNNVIYEDGSIYNLYLGAWLVTKEEVAKWKRKKEREKNLLW
ncbi:Ribbon-helix-helix protein, copG family [Aciduliprofundum boonei T469]|nr:Ribbon-helix-helix protein, copG family [Aciduliprofundum boonei T469]